MKVYAIRCIKADHGDPKISWQVGDWVGTYHGNPTQDFDYAETWANPGFVGGYVDSLNQVHGCEFELVEFVPSGDI